jgi:hypothetical protein
MSISGHWDGQEPRVASDREIVGDVTQSGDHAYSAVAGETGDAMDARGVDGLGEGRRLQDGGEPPRQPRLPSPRGA